MTDSTQPPLSPDGQHYWDASSQQWLPLAPGMGPATWSAGYSTESDSESDMSGDLKKVGLWLRERPSLVLFVVFFVLISSCTALSSGDDKPTELAPPSASSDAPSDEKPESEPEAKPTAPEVDWVNYSPDVKTRIDRWGRQGDCYSLQSEFDVAVENNDAQYDRMLDGNDDLMGYIIFRQEQGGCVEPVD